MDTLATETEGHTASHAAPNPVPISLVTHLTEQQLSSLLNISVRTLQVQRCRGAGIPFVKIGRLVRYDVEAVREYLDGQRRTSTGRV